MLISLPDFGVSQQLSGTIGGDTLTGTPLWMGIFENVFIYQNISQSVYIFTAPEVVQRRVHPKLVQKSVCSFLFVREYYCHVHDQHVRIYGVLVLQQLNAPMDGLPTTTSNQCAYEFTESSEASSINYGALLRL